MISIIISNFNLCVNDMKKLISTWYMSYEGMKIAKEMIVQKGSVQDALKLAIQAVEKNPKFHSVGTGGLPNQEGFVQLDAAYMNGTTLAFGGVIEAKQIKSPIAVSIHLAKYQVNCLLAGSGADRYAKENKFEYDDHLTNEAFQIYLKKKNKPLKAYEGHDTVCILGYDEGKMHAGVSTSGLFMKYPGRVGDSPIIGSGFYADDELGACAATGLGEDIMRGCLSIRVLLKAQTTSIQKALETTLDEHILRMKRAGRVCDAISLIAFDKHGNIGAVTNIQQFPFVVVEEDDIKLYCASYINGEHSIMLCDEEWLKNYTGD